MQVLERPAFSADLQTDNPSVFLDRRDRFALHVLGATGERGIE